MRSFVRRIAWRTCAFVPLRVRRSRMSSQSFDVMFPERIWWSSSLFDAADVSFCRNASLSRGAIGFEAFRYAYKRVSKNTLLGTRNAFETFGPHHPQGLCHVVSFTRTATNRGSPT